MKKILLAIIVSIAFSSVSVTAQTVFIPRPPVVYIPLLDPVRMHIQNQVFRNMVTAEAQKGGKTNAKKRSPATGAVDYTMFNPRQENYLPKLLAQAGKGNAAEQRQTEQFLNSLIERYEQAGNNHHLLPPNDVAYALVYFILVNYEAYYDLVTVPIEKDPWAKRARTESHRTALMNEKRSLLTTEDEDRAMYYQFKELLSAKPEFKKVTDAEKQKMTETLVIMSGITNAGYLKAIEEEDEQLLNEARKVAKDSLEQLLGVPIDKIKFNLSGMHLK
jgi:hypothetical protein